MVTLGDFQPETPALGNIVMVRHHKDWGPPPKGVAAYPAIVTRVHLDYTIDVTAFPPCWPPRPFEGLGYGREPGRWHETEIDR